jgi:predicted transposase YbfD/YdcC
MDLLDHFAKVGDPRRVRWVDHPVSVVLALCAGAVVAGMRSFTAIAGWVADTPADLLMSVYARCGRVGDGDVAVPAPPSKATIWRVLTEVDAASVDAAVGAWLWERGNRGDHAAPSQTTEPVSTTTTEYANNNDGVGDVGAESVRPVLLAVDGKTVRGAIDAEGNQTHLLAAMTHQQGLVIAQTEVDGKTNEIPMLPTLLDELDITDAVITADALHTQRATARYLHDRGAEFVFCVKENQPKLFAALNSLPWNDVPVGHTQTDRGPRADHHTHPASPARARRPALPPRPPSLPARTLRHRPCRHDNLSCRRTGNHQSDRDSSQPTIPGRRGTRPLGYRVTALATRHPLPRRQLNRTHPIRTPSHGRPPQPRHRRTTPNRTHRHHRNHPMGQPPTQPTIHHPRTHNMILKRPWFLPKVEEWVDRSRGKIRADVAHEKLVALGYRGSQRTTRRAVAEVEAAFRAGRRRVHRPWWRSRGCGFSTTSARA